MNTTTSRNILVLSLSVFILSMGQNMWFAFAPEYLRLLGAGIAVVGVFSSLQSFFEAIYNYPAGRFLDRYGLRATLVGANIAAAIGYLIYLLSPNFIVVFIGLPFVMIWPAFIVPTTIGLLAREAAQRAGSAQLFTREIMTRLPTLLAPTLGGLLIGLVNNNVVRGVQVGLVITLIASLVTLLLQGAGYQAEPKKDSSPGKNIFEIWSEMSADMKRMLWCELLVKYADVLPRALIAIYALKVLQSPAWAFGLMLALEIAVSIFARGRLNEIAIQTGYKRWLTLSFLATAVFPITVLFASHWSWLFLSFLIAGFKAAGRPARSVVLTKLANREREGQHVGLYETLIDLAVLPAGVLGGVLWQFVGVGIPFWLALIGGLIGCGVYYFFAPEVYPEKAR